MPVSFLTEEQEKRYGKFACELSVEQLARYFHLDDSDLEFVSFHRKDYMRLGVAVQIGTVRFLGTFLDDPAEVPETVSQYMATQLNMRSGEVALRHYGESRSRFRHVATICERYGYQPFANPSVQFRLNRWLYALCWTGSERPSVLFDRTISWLLNHKILLPGLTTLERSIARVRMRVNTLFWQCLTEGITAEQQARLEGLLVVPESGRQSLLDRLRNGPVLTSSRELTRAIYRLREIQDIANDLPPITRLSASRVSALARFAALSKAQAISRMPTDRRLATLVAFVQTLAATAYDDVLDLYDIVVNDIFAEAKKANQKTRLRTLKDLDEAAMILRNVSVMVLDEAIIDGHLRKNVLQQVPRDQLSTAIAQVDALVSPDKDLHFKELRQQEKKIGFLNNLVCTVPFNALPSGNHVVEAAHYLREVASSKKRRGDAPTAFVPKAWKSQISRADGSLDLLGYKLCFLDQLRNTVRRRDVFVAPSMKYGDVRKGLLEGAAWDTARPAFCRAVGITADAVQEVTQLTEKLDDIYREVLNGLSSNTALRFENNELVLTNLEKLDEPPSLIELREEIAARIPTVGVSEMLMEIHARTGFASEFTHVSEMDSRATDIETSICAMLMAEACNIGLEPIIQRDIPALRRSRLSWVRQNYMRADTITHANARLVAAQSKIALARFWGGGDVASADGIRFVVPVRTIHAGSNPKYFVRGERGVTLYNLISDQFTGMNGIVIPGTIRDSLYLLAVVLEQETCFEPTEIMTDTGAYTDIMFGIFWLLGYQFSPRLADIGGQRFWRADAKACYEPFDGLGIHRINIKLIIQHWDELLRLAASLKMGTVKATNLMRTLRTKDRPTRLALALQELGRIIKTLYLLNYISDEAYRRRILVQLNRGEGRHGLARFFFHGQRGELRQRYREGQEDQLGALGLVTNAATLWNTIYMDAAVNQLQAEGYPVSDEDKARLSPLIHGHYNVLGKFGFVLPECITRGELRPLRNPDNIMEEYY